MIAQLAGLHFQAAPRLNEGHWEWMVYLEMFIGGVAAGAYVIAAILEVLGRGRSALARAAHLLAFPLVAIAGILLIVDLSRPERFWHMIVQSGNMFPMFKPWSPMSVGSWGLLLFGGFTFVSFVDALIDRGLFSLGNWRREHTLHGSTLGLVWAIGGGLFAFMVSAYSGILMSVSSFPGWSDSVFIGALYAAIAGATGLAAILLTAGLRVDDGREALRLLGILVGWELVVLVFFLATLGPALGIFLHGLPLIAILGGAVLGVVALVMLFTGSAARQTSLAALSATLVLVGGFLLRYAVVMGPQVG